MSVKKKTQKAKPKKTANNPKKKAVKKTAAKKVITKKSSPKKNTPKKVATKKAGPKKVAIKKDYPKKVATKKSTPKKATPEKVVSKKAASKKTAPKKVVEKKVISKKEQFLPEQYVIYPSHGIGQILEIEKKEIAGQMLKMYVIEFEKEKMILRVPVEKTKEIGVRKVSTKNQLKEIFEILTGKAKIRRTMWSRRAQEYEAKISSGKIYELAEVVRDLNKGDDLMIDQSYSERQLFEKAYDRILSEFQIVLNVSREDTQKKLDKALKRNLNKEVKEEEKDTKSSSSTTSTSELTVEEPISDDEEQIDE